jgi:hypothetical protein
MLLEVMSRAEFAPVNPDNAILKLDILETPE